jgi:hypothetical protein
MRRIKRALDPHNIMNPGTIFPEDVPALPIRSPLAATGLSAALPLDPG